MAKAKAKSNQMDKAWYALALARISLGFIFIWAFFDKLFGLGFATCRDAKTEVVSTFCDKAWVNGGSPTTGFLKFAAKGPFKDFYNGLAGNTLIDWLFMVGILLIGIALIAGIATKLAAVTGSLLLLMMWTAALWPDNNPVLDDHIVYIFVLGVIGYSGAANQKLSISSWWSKQSLAKKFPILR